MTTKRMMILIAGPYKSGTDGDPAAAAANLRALEAAAQPIFDAGHVPMIGEWVALPVLAGLGATAFDPVADEVLYPTAQRLLRHHVDAVLRLPGASRGADQDVETAQELGLPVYHDLSEIPRVTADAA
jgi:hypothetical protein